MTISLTDIRSISNENLCSILEENNFPSYRSKQIKNWSRKIDIVEFNQMSNLPKRLVNFLNDNFCLNKSEILSKQRSSDDTIKYAIKLYDGKVVESVLIPSNGRVTACVSSQVGCSLDCNFCATSLLKNMRNLHYYEIFDQIMLLNDEAKYYLNSTITNIVFMGMGEPLLNYKNVLKSIDYITSDFGLGISFKKITVSTSGISKTIKRMADDDVKFNLAVSLHSAIEETRNIVMPFTKSFPLKKLVESLDYWYKKTKRKITFEYLVWKGINDDFKHIDSLIEICKRVPSKVNLIEYNSTDNSDFKSADIEWINNYINVLKENKIAVSLRRSRGTDIQAACGQLANKY